MGDLRMTPRHMTNPARRAGANGPGRRAQIAAACALLTASSCAANGPDCLGPYISGGAIGVPALYTYCLDASAEHGCGRLVTSNLPVDQATLALFLAHAEAEIIDMTTRDIKNRDQRFLPEVCANSEYRIDHITWPHLGTGEHTTFFMSCPRSGYGITATFTFNLANGELVQFHSGYLISSSPA